RPDLTMLLDIAPETAAQRKASGRDRYERDLALLSRVRHSYQRQATGDGWLMLDGERPRDAVSADVVSAVEKLLAQPYTHGPHAPRPPAALARTTRASRPWC